MLNWIKLYLCKLYFDSNIAGNYDYQAMPQLKNKSEINVTVARLLCDKQFYPSVPHPAYYSCLQLMKHIICNKINIDYCTQKREISSSRIKSHRYYIEKVRDAIENRNNLHEASQFQRKIRDLKSIREEADYDNVLIDRSIAEKSIRMANDTIITLQKFFL